MPLVIGGDLFEENHVHISESTWDGISVLDKLPERAAIIVTRGASNHEKVRPLLREGMVVYVWQQNDKAGREFAENVARIALSVSAVPRIVKVPEQFKDLNDWTNHGGATTEDLRQAMANAETIVLPSAEAAKPAENATSVQERTAVSQPPASTKTDNEKKGQREPRIRFYTPCQLRDYQPDPRAVLVGDCHVMRGEVFVLGGEPGVGKSLSGTQLARCGATLQPWFNLPVPRQFKTMIIQTENGRYRLKQEYTSFSCDEIEKFICVSEPPPFGLTLTNKEFLEDIHAALDSFGPDLVILDPWNAATIDDKQRDYRETFDALRNMLPTGSNKPALGIHAHTRKPKPDEKRTGGTGLMHLLAGSYILTSVPRCIFIMVRGSQDETDDSVVLFNPKNNQGELAYRSAWHRSLSGFTPDTDFDWTDFDKPPSERKIITLDQVRAVFADGQLDKKEAAHRLATLAGIRDTSAYRALDVKFAANIRSDKKGNLTFRET